MKSKDGKRFGSVEAAKRIKISTERLRYWERRGIVDPAYIQCGTRRYRRFSLEDIKRAILVKALVDKEKYSLEGAIGILKGEKSSADWSKGVGI